MWTVLVLTIPIRFPLALQYLLLSPATLITKDIWFLSRRCRWYKYFVYQDVSWFVDTYCLLLTASGTFLLASLGSSQKELVHSRNSPRRSSTLLPPSVFWVSLVSFWLWGNSPGVVCPLICRYFAECLLPELFVLDLWSNFPEVDPRKSQFPTPEWHIPHLSFRLSPYSPHVLFLWII